MRSLSYDDQTQVGLSRSPDANPKLIRFVPIVNMRFELPPNKVTTVDAAQAPLLSEFLAGRIYFVAPHMHLLGTQATMSLEMPNGTRQPLIDIPAWDFNWQGAYRYTRPIDYPKGSRLRLTCKFDNTGDNRNNPNNPLTTVRWGEGTNDEMGLGFVGIVSDRQPGGIFNFLAGAMWRFAPPCWCNVALRAWHPPRHLQRERHWRSHFRRLRYTARPPPRQQTCRDFSEGDSALISGGGLLVRKNTEAVSQGRQLLRPG